MTQPSPVNANASARLSTSGTSRAAHHLARPFWLWPIALVTTAYLMVELGFNAQLLDTVGHGTLNDAGAFDGVEHWGRCLSGFAAALFVWPWLLNQAVRRCWSRIASWGLVVIITGVIMALVYHGEKSLLVDRMVDNSSPTVRQDAVNLGLLQQVLVAGSAQLDGLSVPDGFFQAPDGKTFLSLFPLMTLSVLDLDQRLQSQKPGLVRGLLDETYGGAGAAFNRYQASLAAWRDRYNHEYREACERYNTTLNGLGHRQNTAWNDYLSRLRRRRLTPTSVPSPYWNRVRNDVRSQGVPVPQNWIPSDRVTFYEAIETRVTHESRAAFQSALAQALTGGEAIAPNLSFPAFMATAPVQGAWHKAFGDPRPGGQAVRAWPLDLPATDAGVARFRAQVYDPLLVSKTADYLARYNAAPGRFADTGDLRQLGRASMENLVAPPMALAFSLAGALFHLFKALLLWMHALTGWSFRAGWRKGLAILVGVLALSLASLWFGHSAVTATPIYQKLEYQTAQRLGRWVSWSTRAVIQGERVAYPVFETVRTDILRGYRFGYRTPTPQ